VDFVRTYKLLKKLDQNFKSMRKAHANKAVKRAALVGVVGLKAPRS